MPKKKNRYDEAFDNLWADQVSKPGEYSEFEQEEAAIKIQAVMRGRQTRRDIAGQSKKNKREKRKKQRKAEKEAKKRKRREKNRIDNQEIIKTNALSDLERKVAELEMKHVEKEKKGFIAGARNRIFGSTQPKKDKVIDHKKLREEREAAARKIQAIQRGKVGRKKAQQQKEQLIKRENDKQIRREQLKREKEERLLRNQERNAMYEEKRNARKQKLKLQSQMDADYKREQRKKAEMRRRKNKKKGNAQQLLAQQRIIQYNAMVSIFNQFDGDGGGTISMYELRNMCIHMSQENGLELPYDEELQQTINLMSKNKNATSITLSQFEDWIGTIFTMSKKQMIDISRKSPFHQRYVNLINICMAWLNNILENETLRRQYYDNNNFPQQNDSKSLSPRQRRKQQALIQRQQEELGYNNRNAGNIRIGSDAAARRHKDIMETRRQNELDRIRQLEAAEKERKEAEMYRAKNQRSNMIEKLR